MGETKKQSVGERLLQERREHGHTQAHLANLSGKNVRTISRYELGESLVDSDFLLCLAKLDYDVHFILWEKRAVLPLSGEETKLIQRYRELDVSGKAQVQKAVS